MPVFRRKKDEGDSGGDRERSGLRRRLMRRGRELVEATCAQTSGAQVLSGLNAREATFPQT